MDIMRGGYHDDLVYSRRILSEINPKCVETRFLQGGPLEKPRYFIIPCKFCREESPQDFREWRPEDQTSSNSVIVLESARAQCAECLFY